MRVYSFNDFKYICYVEGEEKAVERLFSESMSDKEIKKLHLSIKKSNMKLKEVYEAYLENQAINNY